MRLLGVVLVFGAIGLASAEATGAEPSPPPADRKVTCEIRAGALTGCEPVFRVVRGQSVEITWTADTVQEIHLHGYVLKATPGPATPTVLAFVATIAGRFPVELHDGAARPGKKHAHRPLLYVEVLPR
ncbi:MAG: hypothetical protein ABT940_12705 [Alphaproteobacteria bacterium]